MKSIITQEFNDHLNFKFREHPQILKFLLNHERKQLCIDNLVKEFRLMEWSPTNYDLVKITSLKALARDYANMFANAALKLKQEQLISEAEKQRRMHENQQAQDYMQYLNEDADAIVDTNSK